MVLKKASFKSVLNNKTPLITNFIQSQKLQSNRNINNDSKINDCSPKIRNVSNFHNTLPKFGINKPDSGNNLKIKPQNTHESHINLENQQDNNINNNDIELDNPISREICSYTHNSNDDTPAEYSNESFYSQSDDDVFKILIATDTHLGYKDDDKYLSEDSFNTMHEILYLADKLNVDCIFHSGDFFDQNKPSRSTMYKAMELLNKYCLGNSKVKFEVYDCKGINDDGTHVSTSSNLFNDKHNIKIPIFMIHGNHDNPLHNNGLSPIDILNISGLVTYFGKIDDFNHILVKPLLLKKGNTKIALYGLGWIKDERLLSAFQRKKIEFLIPNNISDWISILLFHQNRYRCSGPSAPMESCIPESYIPDFIDLVIWGHEHESQRAPIKSNTKNHRILQLGSSIITSLIELEALPKHVALLEVKLDSYKIYPIRLETVRPLFYKQITLSDYDLLSDEKSVWDFLTLTTQQMLSESPKNIEEDVLTLSMLIDNLKEKHENIFSEIIQNVNKMPLVRLKVDYTGFPTINPKSFGSQFIGKIANPFEIVRFFKRKTPKKVNQNLVDLDVQRVDSRGIFDIIYENVNDGNRLSFFSEHQLNLSVQEFVLGMDSKAISTFVSKYIDEIRSFISNASIKYNLNEDDLIRFIEEKALEKANMLRKEVEFKKEDKIDVESTCSENSDNVKRVMEECSIDQHYKKISV